MPRDASGNYTLPLGNPVVGGTVIDVNWANPTMADIATQLNNVYTRDGLLGPLAPFKLIDGAAAAPALTFNSEPGLGLYRESAHVLTIVSGGVAVAKFADSGVVFVQPIQYGRSYAGAGAVDAPSMTFANETNTGFYMSAEGTINTTILGVNKGGWYAGGLSVLGLTSTVTLLSTGAATFQNGVQVTGTASNIAGLNVSTSFETAAGVVSQSVVNNIARSASKISMGWATPTAGGLNLRVDGTDFGLTWPIGVSGNAGSATFASKSGTLSANGAVGGAAMTFNYAAQGGTPTWLWGTSDGTAANHYVYSPGGITVGNSNALGGFAASSWIRGDGANMGGFASNLLWQPYLNKVDYGTVFLCRNGGDIGGFGRGAGPNLDVYSNAGGQHGYLAMSPVSDVRVKRDIAPSEKNALADIQAMEFIQFRYTEEAHWYDRETLYNVGFSGQNLHAIDPQYVEEDSEGHLAPSTARLLPLTLKAIQELEARVTALEL